MKAVKFLLVLGILLYSGCGGTFWAYTTELFMSDGKPTTEQINESYEAIEIGGSNAADVLGVIRVNEFEDLVQSNQSVAAVGTKKDAYERWMKLAAFDETDLVVRRKYLVMIDEKPKQLFVEPWAGLRIDLQAMVAEDVLEQPYASSEDRRIAIIEHVKKQAIEDTDILTKQHEIVDSGGTLINQALNGLLLELDASQALAMQLDTETGVMFDHLSLNEGLAYMVVEGNVVTMQILAGSYAKCRVTLPWDGL